MRIIMSLLVLSVINTAVSSDSALPTEAEQANLLVNVQEVFENVKLLVKDEAQSTDDSVIRDIELILKRAEYTLKLLEEVAQLRLSTGSNSICMLDHRPAVERLATEGRDTLRVCARRASEDIRASSNQLANVIEAAVGHGQQLLDSLNECSKKRGLAVISCYKNIIATDVVPVKRTLLGAVEAHRTAHLGAARTRDEANGCVDGVVSKYRDLLEGAVREGLSCV